MKKFLSVIATLLCFVLAFSLVACNNNQGGENETPSDYTRPANANIDNSFTPTSKILIAYFSKTNTTKGVAEKIQELTDADIFEIERKEPYPDAYTPTTEVAQDEKNANARPELASYIPDEAMAQYDTIILGFPIWWHTAPMPVLSFLNYYDVSGKTIYTFCTAASSPITESTADIRSNADGATVVEGKRFSSGSDSSIETWIEGLGLKSTPETPIIPDDPEKPEIPEQPETPEEPTASLTYQRNGDSYTVTGVGENDSIVVIPDEYEGLPVTTIGESAFAYSRHNEDITSVTIPDSVTTIERNAFYNRDELVTVSIGTNSNLQTIGNNAFSGNHTLTSIFIPATVTEIGDSVFNNCGSIEFTVAANNTVYRSENGHLIERATNILIRGGQSGIVPEGIATIAQAAFRRSTAVTELVIPVSVTTLGNYFIADSSIVTVRYQGSEEEWNQIQKSASMWNFGNRDVELVFKSEASILVVYFSATNNTERVAQYIANATGGDLFELVPVNPYSSADLSWTTAGSRVNREHDDESLRDIELVSDTVVDWEDYDTVFIGYPIWWGIAAWPVNNFVKNNDFTGKTVIPFCTSSSSGIGQSGTLLAEMAGTGNWQAGQRFSSGASESTVTTWVNGLDLAA